MDIFIDSIFKLYKNSDKVPIEGFILEKQSEQLSNFIKEHPEIKMIAETGFNAGMSAATMLNVRPDIKVYSFDIVDHSYVISQKNIIDELFKQRHTLITGNSLYTIPHMLEIIKEPIFDFVFIDGGHKAPVPESDIRNLLKLLKPGCYMCVDDYNEICGGLGVIEGVNKVIEEKLVEVDKYYKHENRAWIYLKKP